MPIEKADEIDAIGVEDETSFVVLTIVDSMDWNDPKSNHLLLLQEKLNTYLALVESGEIFVTYPDAKERPVKIHIIGNIAPSQEAKEFLKRASSMLLETGIVLDFSTFETI